MVKYGITPMQAIQAATIGAAQALGHDKEFGSIAAGKSADMIAVESDPATDVRVLEHVKAVLKQGAAVCSPDAVKCRDAS